ncbi:hypothetical protein AFK68_14085 [Hydrocoleum sp. CS-953]|nr:hypothetical protein AFK68_14085 [Hydrocoleum sp. CS-953]
MKIVLNYLIIILSIFALQNFALAETNTLEKKPKNSQSEKIFPINYQPETPGEKLAAADRLYLAGIL